MKTSVALCTYNGEKFLKQQIDSILNQSTKVDEIVICDDCSTDSTIDILKKYQQDHPEIFKIHQNKNNLKSVKNFEKAISLCENDIIFLSDQDDIWVENKVETILKNFENYPDISVIATNGFGIDENGTLLDVITVWDVPSLVKKRNYKFDCFDTLNFVGNFATGATMAFRAKIKKDIFPFPIADGFHHDEWIALNTAKKNQFLFLDEKLIYYREHSSQQIGGVFYENTPKKIESLTDFFSLEKDNMSFSDYKKLLKRVAFAYKKNFVLSNSLSHYDFFQMQKTGAKNKFFSLKKEMKRKYPIRSFFLNVTDKITHKRQL